MESCQKVAGGEYMIIQISGNVWNEKYFSKGGKGFFYPLMTSFIGICIPQNCHVDELAYMKNYFRKQALLFGYMETELTVDFIIQNQITSFNVAKFGPVFSLVLVAMIVLLFIIMLGSIIEVT